LQENATFGQLSTNAASSSPPTLSTLNLSSNNFSKELANLASLTNSSDNTLENPPAPPLASSSAAASISCDNQFNHHSSDVMDLSMSITAPSSVDSACNGTSTEPNNQTMPDDVNHQAPSSSASSTSSGNFSAATPPNVFESSAFSSNYLCTLLANIENEISLTQQHLDDENDKRHKYKVRLGSSVLSLKVSCESPYRSTTADGHTTTTNSSRPSSRCLRKKVP
jgi:hypothetical protein